LQTAAAFVDQGCRYQATAEALGIHVSTVRYRVGSLHKLFALDLDVDFILGSGPCWSVRRIQRAVSGAEARVELVAEPQKRGPFPLPKLRLVAGIWVLHNLTALHLDRR
jgi:PucR C-terminal helix-turn-helix domain